VSAPLSPVGFVASLRSSDDESLIGQSAARNENNISNNNIFFFSTQYHNYNFYSHYNSATLVVWMSIGPPFHSAKVNVCSVRLVDFRMASSVVPSRPRLYCYYFTLNGCVRYCARAVDEMMTRLPARRPNAVLFSQRLLRCENDFGTRIFGQCGEGVAAQNRNLDLTLSESGDSAMAT
jgi:hypothetical protein